MKQQLDTPSRAGRSDAIDEATKKLVQDFYLSDKISRTLPGKKDAKTVKLPDGTKERRQKHLLQYIISDVHQLFLEEYPDITIGLSKFKEFRPPEVMPLTVRDQVVCACSICENAQLLFEAVRRVVVVPVQVSSLHQFLKESVCSLTSEKCCSRECADCGVEKVFALLELDDDQLEETASVRQWVKDDSNNGYLNLKSVDMPVKQLMEKMKSVLEPLAIHEYGKNRQIREIYVIKEKLDDGHVDIHEDFS